MRLSRNVLECSLGFLALVAVLTGCQHGSGRMALHCKQKSTVVAPQMAFVGGLVPHPAQIDVGAGTITLSQSLEIAGGAIKAPPVAQQLDGYRQFEEASDAYLKQLALIEQLVSRSRAMLETPPDAESSKVAAMNAAEMVDFVEKTLESLTEQSSPLDSLKRELELTVPEQAKSSFFMDLDTLHDQMAVELVNWQDSISQLERDVDPEITNQKIQAAETVARNIDPVIESLREFLGRQKENRRKNAPADMGYIIDNSSQWLMVCLTRQRVKYHYLYELATHGEAASIVLTADDFVSVVRIQDTALANERSGSDGIVQLAGWTSMAGEVASNELQQISQISGPENVDVPPQRLRIQIRRRGIAEFEDSVFVLPFESRTKWPVSQLQMHDGDQVTVLPDIQSPLVMEQMVGAIVASGLAEGIEVLSTKKPALSQLDRTSLWMREQTANAHKHFGRVVGQE
jgi:hypothetical protein